MKNKLFYILIGILFSFSFSSRVYAATVVSTNVDKKEVAKGTEVSIKVNLKSDVKISSCLFKVDITDNIEISERNSMNGWNAINSSGGYLVQSTSDEARNINDGKNILELRYKVHGDGDVTVKTDYCIAYETDEKITGISDVTNKFTVTALEDTNLSSLIVTGGVLSPSFSSNVYSYTVTGLKSSNFGLSLTASNTDYQDKIVVKNESNTINDISNIVFKDESGQGKMPITITVNGKTTYNLLVIYEQSGLNNTLKSVTIGGKNLELVSGKYDYEYTVSKDTKTFRVEPVLNDTENFKFGNGSNFNGEFSINDVVHVVIVVEPKSFELGTSSRTYTITVKKDGVNVDKKPIGGNVNNNPTTGDVSMYVMASILIISLIGSVILYKKNLEAYK